MKKYKILLKIIIIAICLILLIVLINIGRKTYILTKITEKSQELSQNENYYWNVKIGDREISTYRNGEKALTIMDNGLMTISKNEDLVNTYIDGPEGKIARLNEKEDNPNLLIKLPGLILKENISPVIISAFNSKISGVVEEGKESYLIESSADAFIIHASTEKVQIFIDKETGLPIKMIEYNNEGETTTTTYKYEFNEVTDEDLKEPDVNEYKVMQ